MAVIHRLGERVADAGTDPDHGGLLDAEPGGNLIGGAKPDAPDVTCQPVGIFADYPNGIGPIGLEYSDRPRGADPVGVQEQHDLADDLLLRPAGDDPAGALGTDPVHFAQPLRLLLNDVE